MIHEAGHPLFGIFGEDAAVYGGTALQLLVPLAFAVSFWRRRHSASFALIAVWLAESLLNVARVGGDAGLAAASRVSRQLSGRSLRYRAVRAS